MQHKYMKEICATSLPFSSLSGEDLENRTQFRLSKDENGNDVAHISFMLQNAAQVYEILGPATSLTTHQLSHFSSYSSTECEAAHLSPVSMNDATTLYQSYISMLTSNQLETSF